MLAEDIRHPERQPIVFERRFLIFVFGIYYQICTFKNPIFSTNFFLGAKSLAWLHTPPFDSPFPPPGHLYLTPLPFLLYPTGWISFCVPGYGEHLGNWLLAGSVLLLLIPPFILLITSITFLPLLPSYLLPSLFHEHLWGSQFVGKMCVLFFNILYTFVGNIEYLWAKWSTLLRGPYVITG